MASVHQARDATNLTELDLRIERAIGERDGSLLMAALVVESGKRARADGMGFGQWLTQVEALLKEHAS